MTGKGTWVNTFSFVVVFVVLLGGAIPLAAIDKVTIWMPSGGRGILPCVVDSPIQVTDRQGVQHRVEQASVKYCSDGIINSTVPEAWDLGETGERLMFFCHSKEADNYWTEGVGARLLVPMVELKKIEFGAPADHRSQSPATLYFRNQKIDPLDVYSPKFTLKGREMMKGLGEREFAMDFADVRVSEFIHERETKTVPRTGYPNARVVERDGTTHDLQNVRLAKGGKFQRGRAHVDIPMENIRRIDVLSTNVTTDGSVLEAGLPCKVTSVSGEEYDLIWKKRTGDMPHTIDGFGVIGWRTAYFVFLPVDCIRFVEFLPQQGPERDK